MLSKLYQTSLLLICSILFLSCISSKSLLAKNGYTIKLKIDDAPSQKLYLCHYFGKSGTVFKVDSVNLSKNGIGIMKTSDKFIGGIYILLFADKSANMEFILQNGDNFSLETLKKDLTQNAKFKGRSENNLFYQYQDVLRAYGNGYKTTEQGLAKARNKKDSTKVYDKLKEKQTELTGFRKSMVKKHPNTFLAKLFLAVDNPDVPKELPILPDGTKDSTFPAKYLKTHYWDDYDFQDDRLIYTPIYDIKLKNYFDNLVVPAPDTVIKECDWILNKAEGSPENFKYSLFYLARWTETSKIMGMDEAFVHLVENYYMKGKATWIDSAQLEKYKDRARKIAPNMIGQPAIDLRTRDMNNVITPLSSITNDYTLLIFWEADCGHCKKELPKLDSLYKSDLKKYNLKMFAVESSNEVDKWKKIVKDLKLSDGWQHVYDPTRETKFRSFYDVYSTPTIYLLDKQKKIVGKRVDHTNILGLIEWLEKKKKKENEKNK